MIDRTYVDWLAAKKRQYISSLFEQPGKKRRENSSVLELFFGLTYQLGDFAAH